MKTQFNTFFYFIFLMAVFQTSLKAQVANFSISGNSQLCRNVLFQFNNLSTNANSYQWDFGDGTPIVTTQNPSHSYVSGGSYIITLIASSGSNSSRFSKGIYVKELPTTYFGAGIGFRGFDINEFINFENYSTRSVSYLWQFGDGTTSSVINPKKAYTTSGMKQVTLTAFNGCGDSAYYNQNIEIIDPTKVVPVVSGYVSPTISCPNKNIFLNNYSSNVDSVKWDLGNGAQIATTQGTTIYSYSQKGLYTIKLYAYYKNKIDSASYSVTITDTAMVMPYSSVSPSRFVGGNYVNANCPGKPFRLDGSMGDQIKTVYWRLENGTRLNAMDTNIRFNTIGDYKVWFVANNDCGVRDSVMYSLRVLKSDTFTNYVSSITVKPASNIVCPSGKMSFTYGYVPEEDFQYYWKVNDSVVSNKTEFKYTMPNTQGTHTVKLRIVPQCGVEDSTATVVFTSNSAIPYSGFSYSGQGDRAFCYKDTLKCSTSLNAEYELNPVSHFWDFGDGYTSNAENVNHVFTSPGWHTVIHKSTNSCGISHQTAESFYTVDNLAPVTRFYAYPDIACQGDTVLFDNFTNGADSTIIDFGDGTKDIKVGFQFPHLFHAYQLPGIYQSKIYAYNRCAGDSASYKVTILAKPVIQILMQDTTVKPGSTLTFKRNTPTANKVLWIKNTLSGIDTSSANELTVTYPNEGKFKVYLVGENGNGCKNLDSVIITVDKSSAIKPIVIDNHSMKIYPNPSTSVLNIELQLAVPQFVSIEIFDLNGKLVNSLFNNNLQAGQNKVTANIAELASGIYFCKLTLDGKSVFTKLIKE